jgi:ATP-dependent Clp protease ATP-binding subunit ClpA
MLSKSLEETLRRAMTNASSLKHEFATLEHLLFALLQDQDALEVLKACSVNVKVLEDDIDKYLKEGPIALHTTKNLHHYRIACLTYYLNSKKIKRTCLSTQKHLAYKTIQSLNP